MYYDTTTKVDANSDGTYSTRDGDYSVKSDEYAGITATSLISNTLNVTGTMLITENAQVMLGGQYKYSTRTYEITTDKKDDAQKDDYMGLVADTVVVNGASDSFTNLNTERATIDNLVIHKGKVKLHPSHHQGNSNVSGSANDNKTAYITTSLKQYGGILEIGKKTKEAHEKTKDKTIYYTSGIKGTLTQTGGAMYVYGHSDASGLNITQSGGEIYFRDKVNVGKSFNITQTTGGTIQLGQLTTGTNRFTSSANQSSITQEGSGNIMLAYGSDFMKASTLTLNQTGSGTIDLGGTPDIAENSSLITGFTSTNTTYRLNQTGSGTINLNSGAKIKADTSTIGGTLSLASGASLTTKELNLSKTSNLSNSGTLVAGTVAPTTADSAAIHVTKDGKLNLSDGYGTAEHTTGAIKTVKMEAGELNYKDSVELTELSMSGGTLNITDGGSDNLTIGTLAVNDGSISLQVNDKATATAAPITLSINGSWTMGSGTSVALTFTKDYINTLTQNDVNGGKISFKELVTGSTVDTNNLTGDFKLQGMSEQWSIESTEWKQENGLTYVTGTLVYDSWVKINEDTQVTDSIDDTSDIFATGVSIDNAEVTLGADNDYTLGTKINDSKVTLTDADALSSGDVSTGGESSLIADAGTEAVKLPGTISNSGTDTTPAKLTLSGDFSVDTADLAAGTPVEEAHIGLDGNPDSDGYDTGFFRDDYIEYDIVDNSGTATLNAEDATVTIDGVEYLINQDGETYILPEYQTYFIDAYDTEHAVQVSTIQQASGYSTTLVDMAAGTLTVDGEVELKVTGGKVLTQSGVPVKGSIENATVVGNDSVVDAAIAGNTTLQGSMTLSGTGTTEGNLTMDNATVKLGSTDALASLSSLKTSGITGISAELPATNANLRTAADEKIILNTVIQNSGELTLNGQYDVTNLPSTPMEATLVDVNGNTGENGFSRDEGTTVQMVLNEEGTGAKINPVDEDFGVFIGTREGTLNESTGIVTFGAGVNYGIYTIASGDDHLVSAIIEASKDAQGDTLLQKIQMYAGTLGVNQSVYLMAEPTTNENREIVARPVINVSGNDTELYGMIDGATMHASGGKISAILHGDTSLTVTGDVEISGESSQTGDTIITGSDAKLTIGTDTALGASTVKLQNQATLDLNGKAANNMIEVTGCTVANAENYVGRMEVASHMTFVGEEPASAGCISLRDKGAITAESLRTTTLEALSDKGADRYSEHTIIGDVTINDSGAIILHSGKQITLTRGSLTLGNGVAMVLLDAGGEFAVGDILVTCISGTITGDFSELDYLINNEEQEGYRVEISEDRKSVVLAEEDKPIVDPDDEEDKPIVDPGEDEEDKPIVGPDVPIQPDPAPVFEQATADVLAQGNWGIFTASRAFVNAVQGQRNNMGCIANGRGTAWAALLGATHDIDGSGAAAGSDTTLFGAAVGVDMQIGKRSSLGVAFGYTDAEVKPGGLSDVDQESGYIALYGEHGLKKFANNSCLALDWVLSTGTTESSYLGADWEQDHIQANTRLTWTKKVNERFAYNVFGGVEYFASESDRVAGCKSGSIQNLRGELGVGARYVVKQGQTTSCDGKGGLTPAAPGCERIVVYGELSYINDMVRNNPSIEVNGLRGGGANPGRQGVGIEAGATFRIGERWSANANYSFNAMDDSNEHVLNIGASRTF